jgi:hypothetical protein|tara:strand:- start:82 stop:291 length:210 start_codon:yes stop_codon:yes gene_type:complete
MTTINEVASNLQTTVDELFGFDKLEVYVSVSSHGVSDCVDVYSNGNYAITLERDEAESHGIALDLQKLI